MSKTTIPWDPPDRKSFNTVIGVDPPASWAIWGPDGILAASQEKDLYKAQKTLLDGCFRVGIPDHRRVYAGVVERPYGGKDMQAAIVEAMSCGWWSRELRNKSLQHWHPTASEWRKRLGIGGHHRGIAKSLGVWLVERICRIQGCEIPRTKNGKPSIDACEAVCIALAAWLGYGLMTKGDISHQLVLELGIENQGMMFAESAWRYFEMPFKVRRSPTVEDKILKAIEDQVPDPHERTTLHDPWGDGRPEAEGGEEEWLGNPPQAER